MAKLIKNEVIQRIKGIRMEVLMVKMDWSKDQYQEVIQDFWNIQNTKKATYKKELREKYGHLNKIVEDWVL